MWITWKHDDTDLSWPLTFNQKVELFVEQALGWQLHIADLVANGGTAFGEHGNPAGNPTGAIRHSGFAVLQICLSYFETIGYYMGNPSGSRAAFVHGVAQVFGDLGTADPDVVKALAKALYRDARCGLYHNSRTARVGLGWPPGDAAIAYDKGNDRVIVNPERLPGILKRHLESLRISLLDEANRELRDRFEKRFDRDTGAA
jgi:hypothetical protein